MGIFLSLSYSKTFRIETINTLIHSRSSLENHIPFSRPKWTKSIPSRFQTKTPQKPNPLGRHIPIWLIYERTPWGYHLWWTSFAEVSLQCATLNK